MSGGEGDDTIYNQVGDGGVSISGGAGNDSIDNCGSGATINSGEGNDTVINRYSMFVKLDTGDGDDLIENNTYAHRTDINAGAGNDTIVIEQSSYVKVNGGAGDDSIKIDEKSQETTIKFTSGDGNDTIVGYNPAMDMISLAGSEITETLDADGDLILKTSSGKNCRRLDCQRKRHDL